MPTDAPDPNPAAQPFPGELEEDAAVADDEATAELADAEALPRPPIPRTAARGLVVVASLILCLVLTVAAVVGWTRGTWTYGATSVDRATSQRLARLADQLTQAGAPRAAIVHVKAAARPGINIGDAIEALATAQQILQDIPETRALLQARAELNLIYRDLTMRQYGHSPETPFRPTPRPHLTPQQSL